MKNIVVNKYHGYALVIVTASFAVAGAFVYQGLKAAKKA